ncbi:MAG TPA: RNA polymerase sigma factor [Terriglobia bacterium]|nr:RNA polymerase sigma factor [Terriglobia bacterium]
MIRPAGEPVEARTLQVASDYRRLLARLASRAGWLGSRDPEGAAQEALKRSLENTSSQQAVRYYFGQDPPSGLEPPEWPLDQLFAWVHGVLYNVVREERHRVGSRREVRIGGIEPERSNESYDPADTAPGQLDVLIQKELQGFVVDCLPRLEHEQRRVLTMRVEGLKYGEIAMRLGVSENTVATWVSRGIQALARCVRKRTERLTGLSPSPEQGIPHD